MHAFFCHLVINGFKTPKAAKEEKSKKFPYDISSADLGVVLTN